MKRFLFVFLFLLVAATASATVSTTSQRVKYNCDGATTTYAYSFPIYEDDDLVVTQADSSLGETTLVLNVDYTVTGAGGSGGNVVLTDGSSCTSTDTLTIIRSIELTQDVDLVDGEAFSAETLEEGYDKQTLVIQDLKEKIDRTFSVPKSSALTGLEVNPSAGYAIGWNADGDGLTNISATTLSVSQMDYVRSGETLTAAVTRIGTTETLLLVDHTVAPGSTTVTLPDTLDLGFVGGGTISGTATIDMNGVIDMGGAKVRRFSSGITVTGDYTFADVPVVQDLVDLKALPNPGIDRFTVYLARRTTDGDGGDGKLQWRTADQSANVTADTLSGIYVPPDSDSTGASGAWVRIYSGHIDVKWFGAAGDGTTDDTAAIQAAIDILGNGDTLFFTGDGSYLVSVNVEAGQDAEVQGAAAYRCLKMDQGNVMIKADGAKIVVDADDDTYGSKGVVTWFVYSANQIKFEGIYIENVNGTEPSDEYYVGIECDNCVNVHLDKMRIGYMGSGIRFTSCDWCKVTNSYIYSCHDTGMNIYGNSTNCEISDSRVINCSDGNCSIYGTNDWCAIRRCYFSGANQLAVIESSTNCTIEDSVFDGEDGASANGPIINRSKWSTIQRNRIIGMQYGIVVRETDVIDAGGNPNWGTKVLGNTIIDTQERTTGQAPLGLWIEYSNNVLVQGNTFARTRKTGTAKPIEIRLLDRGVASSGGAKNENIRIVGNTFQLKHTDIGAGSYNDFHYVLKNDTGYEVNGLSFDGNTIQAERNHGESIFLLDVGSARYFSFQGNTVTDHNQGSGPTNVLTGTIRDANLSNNIIPFYNPSGSGPTFKLLGGLRVSIANNILGTNTTDPGHFLEVDSSASDFIISGNIVAGCNYFIRSDTTPSNFIVTSNIAYHDEASQFSNVTPAASDNNIFTNY